MFIDILHLQKKARFLRKSTLRDHAGWTMTSKMPTVYLHYFGTESANSMTSFPEPPLAKAIALILSFPDSPNARFILHSLDPSILSFPSRPRYHNLHRQSTDKVVSSATIHFTTLIFTSSSNRIVVSFSKNQ